MLSERLKAFSSGKVTSLHSIADVNLPMPLDKVIAICAQGSPRNVVRICKEILDQQSELNSGASKLSEEAINAGFATIARNLTQEIFSPSVVKDLQRVRRCDFTIRYVYSDVFRFTQPAGLNKVRSWQNTGAVIQLGTIQEAKGKKPSNHYGLANVLLAKYVFQRSHIRDFIEQKIRICPTCKSALLRDWDMRSPQQCNHCQGEVQ